MKKKIETILCIVLFVALIIVLGLGVYKSKEQSKSHQERKKQYESSIKSSQSSESNKEEEADKAVDEKKEEKKEESFEGKVLLSLGDGVAKTGNYESKIKENLSMGEAINGANNGLLLKTIITSVTSDDLKKSNIVLVNVGINDYTKNTIIGNREDNKDADTYCGNIRFIINSIKEANSDAEIVFMTPLKHGNIEGQASYPNPNNIGIKLDDYASAVIDVCKAEQVPVIDLFKESGIESDNISKYSDNQLNLNEEGSKKVADFISEKLKSIQGEN